MGACLGGFDDVAGMADGRGQDLGGDVGVVAEDRGNLPNEVHALPGDVVNPSQEGTDESRASQGGEQGLVGIEDEGHVDLDALCGQLTGGNEAVLRHGNLHHHVFVPGGVFPGLSHHTLRVGAHHLHAHRALDQLANLNDDVPHIGGRGFGQQGGIGGHTGNDAPGVKGTDFLQ